MNAAIALATERLICPFEGYHRRLDDGGCAAYPDPGTGAAPWTIGYGTTGPGINADTRWTHEDALAALNADATLAALGVLKLSPGLAAEPDSRLAALISFAYNLGLGAYRASTLRHRVNDADWPEAAQELLRWVRAGGRVLPGLVARRTAEAALLVS